MTLNDLQVGDKFAFKIAIGIVTYEKISTSRIRCIHSNTSLVREGTEYYLGGTNDHLLTCQVVLAQYESNVTSKYRF